MKTSAYIQITGLFNQSGIDLQANDTGGELDPHGADLVRGIVFIIAIISISLLGSGVARQPHWRNGLLLRHALWGREDADAGHQLEQVRYCCPLAILCSADSDCASLSFVGSGQFCIKLCDPTVPSPNYCLKCHSFSSHSSPFR